MHYDIAFDTTLYVSESIKEVVTTLLIAIALVVLVIFLFLQDWRTTLIPSITIPISLLGTFFLMKVLGLLDQHADAVRADAGDRVWSSTTRSSSSRTSRASSKRRACRRSRARAKRWPRSTGAVVASSLVLLAVFVPVAFFPGHDRPALQTVRADDRVLDHDLAVQRADADAGALVDLPRQHQDATASPASSDRSTA